MGKASEGVGLSTVVANSRCMVVASRRVCSEETVSISSHKGLGSWRTPASIGPLSGTSGGRVRARRASRCTRWRSDDPSGKARGARQMELAHDSQSLPAGSARAQRTPLPAQSSIVKSAKLPSAKSNSTPTLTLLGGRPASSSSKSTASPIFCKARQLDSRRPLPDDRPPEKIRGASSLARPPPRT